MCVHCPAAGEGCRNARGNQTNLVFVARVEEYIQKNAFLCVSYLFWRTKNPTKQATRSSLRAHVAFKCAYVPELLLFGRVPLCGVRHSARSIWERNFFARANMEFQTAMLLMFGPCWILEGGALLCWFGPAIVSVTLTH